MRRLFTAIGIALSMLVSVWADDFLNLCPDCGREAAESALVCPACKARMPAAGRVVTAAPKPVAEPVAAPAPAAFDPTVDSIQREMTEKGRDLLASQPAEAWYFIQNARAMALLPGAPDPESRRTVLIGFEKQAEAAMQSGEPPCAACGGSGKRSVTFKQYGGIAVEPRSPVSGLACPVCNGKGRLARPFTAEEQRLRKTLGRRLFDDAMRQQGFRRAGRGYLSESIEKGLKATERARFLQAFEMPCEVCAGLAFSDCASCRGMGSIRCTNRSCSEGKVEKKTIKYNRTVIEEETCPVCDGKSVLPCGKCRETGRITCKTCSGSGLARICSRCKGAGLSDCSTCRGTGADRAGGVCAKCEGDRQALCAQCAGEGRLVK